MDSKLGREREAFIQTLGEECLRKVNLVHPEGDIEGVWVAMDKSNLAKYEADQVGSLPGQNEITCYLVNMPLGWGGAVWGSKIVARHGGPDRPRAYLEDQLKHDPYWVENNEALRESIALMLNENTRAYLEEQRALKEDKDGEE